MTESVRCTCLRPLGARMARFNASVAARVALGETRNAAAMSAFQEVGAGRSCCRNYFLNHIELRDRRIHYEHFAQEDKRARPAAIINPDIHAEDEAE